MRALLTISVLIPTEFTALLTTNRVIPKRVVLIISSPPHITSNFAPGVAVPIPTFPSFRTIRPGVPAVSQLTQRAPVPEVSSDPRMAVRYPPGSIVPIPTLPTEFTMNRFVVAVSSLR